MSQGEAKVKNNKMFRDGKVWEHFIYCGPNLEAAREFSTLNLNLLTLYLRQHLPGAS